MAKKTGKGLVALSSAAIVSVYGLGYVVTQPAAVSMAAGTAPSPAVASSPLASPVTGSVAAPSPSAAALTLKDGVYIATGWSRHGSVSVSVTIKNGRIVSAPITGVTTRYSQNLIAGLPGQVVSSQSSRVDMVSGATDSSEAYQSAVSQALAQAGGQPASSAGTTSAPNETGSRPGSVQVTGPGGSSIYRNPGGRHHRGGYGGFGD